MSRLVDRYGSGALLEIGAGTGKLTQQLVERGLAVVAVEPVAEMRRRLVADVPGVEVVDGAAENLPVEAGSFDTVVVGQSFHWFDFRASLDEIVRVLRPGGHLVTVWNVKDGEADWFKTYMRTVDRHAGDTPRHADMLWRAAIDGDVRFEAVDDWRVDHPRAMDKEGVVDRALSTSFIAALPRDLQVSVADEIREVLEPLDEPLQFPYRCELQAWRRRS